MRAYSSLVYHNDVLSSSQSGLEKAILSRRNVVSSANRTPSRGKPIWIRLGVLRGGDRNNPVLQLSSGDSFRIRSGLMYHVAMKERQQLKCTIKSKGFSCTTSSSSGLWMTARQTSTGRWGSLLTKHMLKFFSRINKPLEILKGSIDPSFDGGWSRRVWSS
jgi:hypothetical protein